MPDMKGITVKIPAELHAEVKAYLEAHNMTMGEFIAQAVAPRLWTTSCIPKFKLHRRTKIWNV